MKTLNISICFFEYLNSHGIRYCHWKSNLHLNNALNGKTDLDILIHVDDKVRFEQACKKLDIKQILSPPGKQFPGLEDYLGFDYDTGELIHLHVHYSLILGQKYIKNHHLPIEKIVFSNLFLKDGVAIPIYELELILLIIRAHMKMDFISLIKHGIREIQGRDYSPFPVAINEEMTELINNCDIKKIRSVLLECNLPIPEKLFINFINKFSNNRYKCYEAFITKRKILSVLEGYRRQKTNFVFLKYSYHWLINSSRIMQFVNQKKTLIGRGKIFSLVGADGSGKTTLLADLDKWLSWKLSVNRYYYGIPKTNIIKFIDRSIQLTKKIKSIFLTTMVENVFWSFIAKLRFNVFLASNEDVLHGRVVLTDRFPLKEFRSMKEPMDGPRLIQYSTKISRFFSNVEYNYYDRIKISDKLFILQVNIDELRRRKTDLDISIHQRKAKAVNAIKGNDHVVLIDANNSYTDVQLELKRKIWEFL